MRMVQSEQDIQRMIQDWVMGKVMLKDVLDFKEHQLDALVRLGYVLFFHGKMEAAHAVFEGLIALDPHKEYYYTTLGAICAQEGNLSQALARFGEAIGISPQLPYAYINRAEVYIALKERDRASADLKEALLHMSPRHQMLSQKAWALLKSLEPPSHPLGRTH